jgi:hypothetical protein
MSVVGKENDLGRKGREEQKMWKPGFAQPLKSTSQIFNFVLVFGVNNSTVHIYHGK